MLRKTYFAEQVTGINQTTVAGGAWAMKGCELNLLTGAVNEWEGGASVEWARPRRRILIGNEGEVTSHL